MKNRKALPLSPQSSVTLSVLKIFVPSTVSTPSFIEAVHPISSITPIVALMSFDRATGAIVHLPLVRAAQIIARWTSLFDGGMFTSPFGTNGRYRTYGLLLLSVDKAILPQPFIKICLPCYGVMKSSKSEIATFLVKLVPIFSSKTTLIDEPEVFLSV